jgi:hypothetical protein
VIVSCGWNLGEDRIYGHVKLLVHLEYKLAKVGQPRWLRGTGTSNEENLATCMCKKQALGNGSKPRA